MRVLRLILVVVLAVLLIGIALANRSLVTVGLFPAGLATWLGGQFAVTMPLFLVIFLAILTGLVLGLIWEWLRESGIRTLAQRRSFELVRVEREAGQLRKTFSAPKDDVLAIIDAPKATDLPPSGRGATPAGGVTKVTTVTTPALPARR